MKLFSGMFRKQVNMFDGKSCRFSLPKCFQVVLNEKIRNRRLYALRYRETRTIYLCPIITWESCIREILSDIAPNRIEKAKQKWIYPAQLIHMDSQGRITIPHDIHSAAGYEAYEDIIILGGDNKMEIWPLKEYFSIDPLEGSAPKIPIATQGRDSTESCQLAPFSTIDLHYFSVIKQKGSNCLWKNKLMKRRTDELAHLHKMLL